MPFQSPPDVEIIAAFPEVLSLELLDSGGFKIAYKAKIGSDIEVFKLVRLPAPGPTDEELAYRAEAIGRIRREVELLGRCNVPEFVKLGTLHPRIASIGGTEYVGYSEEYLAGPDLWHVLRSESRPREDEARELFRALVHAIMELWKHRIIHRDIKPKNVISLVNPSRRFVLLDLGIAYSLLDTGLTRDAHIVPGTLRYLAPEMLKPGFRQSLDYRADLYAAGLTVFEYSAQIHPLARSRADMIETLSRIATQAPKLLQSERTDFSVGFCRLVDQTLKKKPVLRPANLERILAQLEND